MKNRIVTGVLSVTLLLFLLLSCSAPAPAATSAVSPNAPAATTAAAPWTPARYIVLIVPFNPGGGNDLYSRAISVAMSKFLGQEVVIKNVPGADGVTGAMELYRSKPDGYTMGLVDNQVLVTNASIKKMDYDLAKYVWVGGCDRYYHVIGVASSSPWYTIADLQKAGETKPLRYAVTGVSLSEIVLPNVLKINCSYVRGYNGTGETVLALLKNDGDFINTADSVILPYVQSKDIRPILYCSSQPSSTFKGVGIELAYGKDTPDLNASGKDKVFALPPGTPDNIAKVIQSAFEKAVKDPSVQDWSKKTSNPITYLSPKDVMDDNQAMAAACSKWSDLLRKNVQ